MALLGHFCISIHPYYILTKVADYFKSLGWFTSTNAWCSIAWLLNLLNQSVILHNVFARIFRLMLQEMWCMCVTCVGNVLLGKRATRGTGTLILENISSIVKYVIKVFIPGTAIMGILPHTRSPETRSCMHAHVVERTFHINLYQFCICEIVWNKLRQGLSRLYIYRLHQDKPIKY